MKRIDVLALKMDSFDTEDFLGELVAYSKNSVLLVHDFDRIVVRYQGPGLQLDARPRKFHRVRNQTLNHYLSPVLFGLDLFLLFGLLGQICSRFRPKVCWIENVWAASIIGVFRRLGFCSRSIYFPGDWLVNPRQKSYLSRLANNFIYPKLDRWNCRNHDAVFYGDEKLKTVRRQYWGKAIEHKERTYTSYSFPGLSIKAEPTDSIKDKICFLGDSRPDSGLDIVIRSLPLIRRQKQISLKVIGPLRDNHRDLRKIAEENGVGDFVDFLGFLKIDKMKEEMADCFCGINVLTSSQSYSSYGIPGKQIHYLQFLLPVIASSGAGTLVPMIEQKGLGRIITPTPQAFAEAALAIHEHQVEYRKNILRFAREIQKIKLKDLIEF